MPEFEEKREVEDNTDEEIREFGTALPPDAQTAEIHCLTIIGQVEGHQLLPEGAKSTKYEHLMPLIAAIEESREVKALLVLLNTAGGDVEAGLGIAELIAGMSKPTASIVLGGGHSIGVPLAVSTKRSYIAPSAAMTIHPVRLNGLVIAAPQSFDYFEKMQERVVKFVLSNSRISRDRYMDYMMRTSELANDMGSVITAREAVDCGLIDEVGTLSTALKYLKEQIGREN